MVISARSKKLLNQVRLSNYQVLRLRNGTHEGFIRGKLQFLDESNLYWREFVDVELTIDRLMYVYQYMDSSDKLVFRYDNSGHHRKLNLSTYPLHKHEGSEDNIVSSASLDF